MRTLAVGLAVLILGGCVEYRESLVLERDDSGTVVMAIGVKEALLRAAEVAESGIYDPASALENLRTQQGLQVIESRTETQEGTRWLHLVLTFESLAALNRVDRIEQFRGLFGHFVLEEDAAGQQVLTRTVRADLPENLRESFLTSLLVPMLARYPWSYEVRFPSRVVETNGEKPAGATNDTHLVNWTFNFGDLATEPRVMRTTFARTGLGPAGIAVGVVLMVIGIVLVQVFQRFRKRAPAS